MSDEYYMQIALDLAKQGFGHVAPNPMVGAVIVHAGKVIGSGYHAKFGGPHAEVNAINSVPKELARLIPESTIYVTLEPCSHFGKTPPCADLLVEKKFKRVAVGSFDPNPKVSGSGIEKLRDVGIEVTEGVLSKECDALNKRFMTFHKLHRPYIILKWAESSDGFMAPMEEKQLWLSGEESKKRVHQMRREEQAILVGTNTIKIDDPALSVRLVNGKNPARIIIDKNLSLSDNKKVFAPDAQIFVYNSKKNETKDNIQYVQINFEENIIPQLLSDLYKKDIQSLIVEGGPTTLNNFIEQDCWDEALIIGTPAILGSGKKSPNINGPCVKIEPVGKDIHRTFLKI